MLWNGWSNATNDQPYAAPSLPRSNVGLPTKVVGTDSIVVERHPNLSTLSPTVWKREKRMKVFWVPQMMFLFSWGLWFFGHFCDCGNFHSPQVGLGKGFSQHLSTSILNGTKFLVTNKNYIRPPAERQRTLVLWPPKIGQLSSWFWGDEIGGCLLRFLGQISSQSTSICNLADFFVRHRP